MEKDRPGLGAIYWSWEGEDYPEAIAFKNEVVKQGGWDKPHETDRCGLGRLAERET